MNQKTFDNFNKNLNAQLEKGEEGHQKLIAMIQKEFEHLHYQPFRASVEHFLETGTVNGSLLLAILSVMQKHQEKR